MRILNAYITRNFLVTFRLPSSCSCYHGAGEHFQGDRFVSRGVSGSLILKAFFYGIAFLVDFRDPMSVLASVYLVFSRMANDREIVAMKASGISILADSSAAGRDRHTASAWSHLLLTVIWLRTAIISAACSSAR